LHIDDARKTELAQAEEKLAHERNELKSERERIAAEETAKAKKAEIKLRKELAQVEEKLARERSHWKSARERIAAQETAKAKKAETELRKELGRLRASAKQMKAALAEKSSMSSKEKRRIEHDATRKVQSTFAQQLRKEEERRLRIEERRDRDAEIWKRKIEELQRGAEARDRVHFGPEGEEELERLLRGQFPMDDIKRKRRSGDIVQMIIEDREVCGCIVYECKQTGRWQPAFIRQLKRAMEAHGTRCGVLVSRVLPSRQSGMCVIDGVIVMSPQFAHHIASILRDSIVELSRVKLSEQGKAEKTQEVYRYLRSEEFKNSLQVIEGRTKELRADLEREKSHHTSCWTRREQHYGAIARQNAGVTTRINEILASLPSRRLAQVHRLNIKADESLSK
jgi:hypothetical protein